MAIYLFTAKKKNEELVRLRQAFHELSVRHEQQGNQLSASQNTAARLEVENQLARKQVQMTQQKHQEYLLEQQIKENKLKTWLGEKEALIHRQTRKLLSQGAQMLETKEGSVDEGMQEDAESEHDELDAVSQQITAQIETQEEQLA